MPPAPRRPQGIRKTQSKHYDTARPSAKARSANLEASAAAAAIESSCTEETAVDPQQETDDLLAQQAQPQPQPTLDMDIGDCLQLLRSAEARLPSASDEGLLALRASYHEVQTVLATLATSPQRWADDLASAAAPESGESAREPVADVFGETPGPRLAILRAVLARVLFLLAAYRADDEGHTAGEFLAHAEVALPPLSPTLEPASGPDFEDLPECTSLRAAIAYARLLVPEIASACQSQGECDSGNDEVVEVDEPDSENLQAALQNVAQPDLVHLGVLLMRAPHSRSSTSWCSLEIELWERVPENIPLYGGIREYESSCALVASAELVAHEDEPCSDAVHSAISGLQRAQELLKTLHGFSSASECAPATAPPGTDPVQPAEVDGKQKIGNNALAITLAQILVAFGELHMNHALLLEILLEMRCSESADEQLDNSVDGDAEADCKQLRHKMKSSGMEAVASDSLCFKMPPSELDVQGQYQSALSYLEEAQSLEPSAVDNDVLDEIRSFLS